MTLFILSVGNGHCQEAMKVKVLSLPQKIKPGGHFTFFFETRAGSDFQTSAETSLELPRDWQIIVMRKTEQANHTTKYIYTISTPSTVLAGSYQIIIVVRLGDKEIREKTETEVVTIRRVEVVPLTSYEYVQEGDSLKLNYLVQNLGNHIEKIKLSTSRGKIEVKNDSLTLYPHKSIHVLVSQKVPETQSNFWEMSNDLFVSLTDSSDMVSGFINIPVYSSKNKKSDPYLRYSLEGGGWYSHFNLNHKARSSFQYDIRGSGFLDFKQRHFMDFTVHGPNQINLPAVGSFDLYSLNYSYKKRINVSLGDYPLRVNNLMEFGRFGRGLWFDQKIGKTGISVFYNQPRFYPYQKDTYGGRFYYIPKENLMFSFDALSKRVRFKDEWFNTQMYGVTAQYRTPVLSFITELAASRAHGKSDAGFFNRINFQVKKFQVSSDQVYVGKNFYGSYHNSWQAVNSFYYLLFKKLNVGLQSNITRLNPRFDTYILNTSPYYTNNSLLLNYSVARGHRLMLSYNQEEKEDRQEIKQFYFKEKYGRLVYMAGTEKVQVWFENRYGLARNLLAAGDDIRYSTSIRSVLQPQVRIFRWFWLGGFGEFQRNAKFSENTSLQNYYYYGGSGRAIVNNVFNASFSYRNNYAPDELIQTRSYMDLSVEWNTRHNRISILGGRMFLPYHSAVNESSLFFVVKYTLKLNVPIAKNKNLGSVKGTITGSDQMPKSGILVNLQDKKFLTDASGNFYFNDLTPDKYYLTLDKSTMGNGIIAETRTPLEVNVEARSVREVTVPLVVSGGIEGKITLKAANQQTDTKPPVILVKISNEKESFLTRPNDNGLFSFKEIQPGKWRIEVSVQGNAGQYEIENPVQSVVVEPGTLKEVVFTIQLKERKIYFSNKSFQLISKK